MNKSESQIRNENRQLATKNLKQALVSTYGEENVFTVGNNEFSVYVGNAPTGEKTYVNFSVKAMGYLYRKTEKRTFPPYDGEKVANAYAEEMEKKRIENEELAKKTKAKKERDEKMREKQRKAREEAREAKKRFMNG